MAFMARPGGMQVPLSIRLLGMAVEMAAAMPVRWAACLGLVAGSQEGQCDEVIGGDPGVRGLENAVAGQSCESLGDQVFWCVGQPVVQFGQMRRFRGQQAQQRCVVGHRRLSHSRRDYRYPTACAAERPVRLARRPWRATAMPG
jgi:hypothetical protein